jgi:hypothetical protein
MRRRHGGEREVCDGLLQREGTRVLLDAHETGLRDGLDHS